MNQEYFTYRREPFYNISLEHLPEAEGSIVVDIGGGSGSFIEYGGLIEKINNLYAVEQAPHSVEKLKILYVSNIIFENVKNDLPFESASVDYIHCSHMIEHLYYEKFYNFLSEVDRVLKCGGVLVISAPTFYPDFYNDLSHVKPYHPAIFINYFCLNDNTSRTNKNIEGNYVKENCIYSVKKMHFMSFFT